MAKIAQMEIMGLAVIIILLALGMFFVAQFTLFKEKPTAAQTFQQRQLASNFISTLLSSNADCPGSSATFTDLIEEMPNTFTNLPCPIPLDKYFESKVKDILIQTLDIWGEGRFTYNLTVVFPQGVPPDIEDIAISNGCPPTSQQETKIFPIPSDFGTILVQMKICY